VSLDLQCMAHAFFTKRSSNHCLGLHCTFFEICIYFDDVPLLDPLQIALHHDSN
jgi:hypothetical protein